MTEKNYTRSAKMMAAYRRMVPGGAHTYSKGADQFPQQSPQFITRGSGSHVWDVDGNELICWSMGLTAVSLGHAYPPVLDAVRRALEIGANFQRPAVAEYEAAEFLLKHLEHYDMVKFAKNGSTVTTAAVKLARAFTGRSKVALCGDQPFFSYDDWFIGTTPCDKGVPKEVASLSLTFRYNDLASVQRLFAEHKDIACVILEPMDGEEPRDGFLHNLQELCREQGAVFILDEMVTGFKWDVRGAQRTYDIIPDIATWGKGIANGFSACAITGRRDIMNLGGIDPDKEKVFLVSTTHGAETHALAAMQATIQEMVTRNIIPENHTRARSLKAQLEQAIARHHLTEYVQLYNHISLMFTRTLDRDKKVSLPLRTLLMQEMIARGILYQGTFYTTWSHQAEEISRTVQAFDESLAVYARALEHGTEGLLVGPPIKPVFRKHN